MNDSDGNFDANQNINLNGDNNNSEELNVNKGNNFNDNNMNQNNELEGQARNANAKNKITDFYKKSSHPPIALTTVGLKLAALFLYLFLDIIASDAFVMIVVILLDAIDFWYTKNISGRLLVGLRWWNKYNPETQQDIWVFESKNEIKEANIDRNTFWISLYGFTGAWLVLSIWECVMLNFTWAFLCLISLAIAGVNTYGFFRCSKLQQKGAIMILKKFAKKKNNN